MSRRAIILGLPGSGTSYYTGLMNALGWTPPPRYEGLDERGFKTWESLRGRCLNRSLLGGSWESCRFDHRFHPKNPESTDLSKACRFVRDSDMAFERWTFKNPESTLTFEKLWSLFHWDHIIGVYRHPDEAVASLKKDHLKNGSCRADLTQTWNRWGQLLLKHCTTVVRFPGDENRLLGAVGGEMPADLFDPSLVNSRADSPAPSWAGDVWARLETHGLATASATAERTEG